MKPKRIYEAIKDQTLFFKQFLDNPTTVGAVLPSSQYLAETMIGNVVNPKRIVEFGPGTGIFTAIALTEFPGLEHYWAFEINPTFRASLAERFPEVDTVPTGAEHAVDYLESATGTIDLVLSGLPFANLPWYLNQKILDGTYEIMAPGAVFSTFVYFHTYQLPTLRRMRRHLKRRFQRVEVTAIWFNFPPAFVIQCFK